MHGILPYRLRSARRQLPPKLSFVSDRREFLAVGHQRSAFTRVDPIQPEDLVIGAGDQ
jgi:hypothetical protein